MLSSDFCECTLIRWAVEARYWARRMMKERDALRAKLNEIINDQSITIAFMKMDSRKENESLQAKLDIAVEVLKNIPHLGFPDEKNYHPWYPHCLGCIAQEALKKLEEK